MLNQVAQPFQGYRQRDRADDHEGLIAQVRGRQVVEVQHLANHHVKQIQFQRIPSEPAQHFRYHVVKACERGLPRAGHHVHDDDTAYAQQQVQRRAKVHLDQRDINQPHRVEHDGHGRHTCGDHEHGQWTTFMREPSQQHTEDEARYAVDDQIDVVVERRREPVQRHRDQHRGRTQCQRSRPCRGDVSGTVHDGEHERKQHIADQAHRYVPEPLHTVRKERDECDVGEETHHSGIRMDEVEPDPPDQRHSDVRHQHAGQPLAVERPRVRVALPRVVQAQPRDHQEHVDAGTADIVVEHLSGTIEMVGRVRQVLGVMERHDQQDLHAHQHAAVFGQQLV